MRVYITGWVGQFAAVVRIHLFMLIVFRLNVMTAILIDVRAIKDKLVDPQCCWRWRLCIHDRLARDSSVLSSDTLYTRCFPVGEG